MTSTTTPLRGFLVVLFVTRDCLFTEVSQERKQEIEGGGLSSLGCFLAEAEREISPGRVSWWTLFFPQGQNCSGLWVLKAQFRAIGSAKDLSLAPALWEFTLLPPTLSLSCCPYKPP